MCLQQVTLDVEIWVNKTLQTELTSQGMSYHSLTDYDLQLAEVYTVKNSDYYVPAHAMFVYNAGLYWQWLCCSCPGCTIGGLTNVRHIHSSRDVFHIY